MQILRKFLKFYIVCVLFSIVGVVFAISKNNPEYSTKPSAYLDDNVLYAGDSVVLRVPLKDGEATSPLHLKDPPNIKTEVQYNPSTNDYTVKKKVGDNVVEQKNLNFKEYQAQEMNNLLSDYWKERAKVSNSSKATGGLLEKYLPGLSGISDKIESIAGLGLGDIEIRPTGSAEITFAIVNNKRNDPALDVRKRSSTSFDFDENIQLNVMAKIGDKINFDMNYNTQALFNFENKLKLKYEGKEDDILQLIEAGDVALTLPSNLIRGSQSLFGIRTKLKFGKLNLEAIFSQQKSELKNIQVQGGAMREEFMFRADEYEENKHFFISQYFYDHYNESVSRLPMVKSNIKITKIEVWRTNIGGAVTENRNLAALYDLGEYNPYVTRFKNSPTHTSDSLPDQKTSNQLLKQISVSSLRNVNNVSSYLETQGLVSGRDFEKLENARRLTPGEFTFNDRLGFITVNQQLSADQVLAVAFQYQIIGDTTIHQVGEFSDEGIVEPNTLTVKLLKSTTVDTRHPRWKLMMKNIYSLRSNQIAKDDFRLNILYEGDAGGVPTGYFVEGPKKGIPLIQVFGLDSVDNQLNRYPDGVFDFIDGAALTGGTIESATGRIYFPLVEPFGKDLRAILNDNTLANKYCFDTLYTKTKSEAQQYPEKNKYYLEGFYQSSMSGEISLGMSVPQGSVTVTAGGIPLIENVDYVVDYMMGKVRILNEAILNSGTPINISNENNSMFSTTTKRMMGLRANYEINKKFNIGATLLNLHETPMMQKTSFGNEPISNTVIGLDVQFEDEVPLITKLIDALPFYSTKAPSVFNFKGEMAYFIPSITKTTGEKGVSYIDDFESAKSTYSLQSYYNWSLASTPQDYNTTSPLFPETAKNYGLEYGFNRAKTAWYRIEDVFYVGSNTPKNITKEDKSKPYARRVSYEEVFPNKELASDQNRFITNMLNVAFYPSERGPYNYDINGVPGISKGINADGTLADPASRWGGIMRKIESSDFEAQNIEYIQFWVMDPFIENPNHKGGQLYFNLGDISEDVLRDGRKSYENGLPTSADVKDVDTTIWGRVPKLQPIVYSFDNDPATRKYQDIGYDGLNSDDERSFFQKYLAQIEQKFGGKNSVAYQNAFKDPSGDDYHYFRGSDYDDSDIKINDRYKYYNNSEGNSLPNEFSPESYSTQATNYPEYEDINKDNTLSEAENYYQYKINLSPAEMVIGKNYIVDIHEAKGIKLEDGSTTNCKWYQFKIPVKMPDKVVGDIHNFQSIRFMRMFMKNFSEDVILRFATLELVRSEWRKYDGDLLAEGDYIPNQSSKSEVVISTVNIEENSTRQPVNYVAPPGVEREQIYGGSTSYLANEQSLSLNIRNLSDGDARAIYKNTTYDFRFFKKMKMYVHAEKLNQADNVNDGDVTVFVRMGNDFINNYYEYEIPLKYTAWYPGSVNDIWPEQNDVEIDFDQLVDVKENRNRHVRSGSGGYSQILPYSEYVGKAKITVKGTPNIGNVKTMMIGVRNPKKQSLSDGDDMMDKSVEIWVNELRLTDFNTTGGWAATALARTTLADLGDVSIYGAYTSSGYGSLDQRIADLNTSDVSNIDFATNLELGKFFSEKYGIHIPVHFDISNTTASPKYNPLDPDVKLDEDLDTYPTQAARDSLSRMVDDVTIRTNLNFMNVRKERVGKRAESPKFYQIENLDASYSYSHESHRNIDIEYNDKTQHKISLGYNYGLTPKSIKPFGGIGFMKSKNWAIIRDFDIFYQLKNFSFRSDIFRDYQEAKMRNKSRGAIIIDPTYFKEFYWNRQYNLQYNLTSNFYIQYDAVANARIDEPQGKITSNNRDTIWRNLSHFGQMQTFTQKLDFNWNVPINKLPYMDWVRLTTSYGVQYTFTGVPKSLESLGNTIQNSNNFTVTGNLNFTTLYNKSSIIKEAYQKPKPKPKEEDKKDPKAKEAEKDKKPKNPADSTQKKEMSESLKAVLNFGIRLITGIKTVSVNYTKVEGMMVPGYNPSVTILGMSFSDNMSPGAAFIMGLESDNFMQEAIGNGWMVTSENMTSPVINTLNETFRAQATLEPIRDLKIDLTFNRSYTENRSAYYKTGNNTISSDPSNFSRTGAFSITTWAFASSFSSDRDDYSSALFDEFLNNRQNIAMRLANENESIKTINLVPDSTDQNKLYPLGYNSTAQQVLIASFLSTYLGKDPSKVSPNPFLSIPLPNWRITYNGLTKMELFKKWFNNIAFSHGYMSTYSVGNYRLNARITRLSYDYLNEDLTYDISGNFIPKEEVDVVVITEQFSPLIKMDLSMKNHVQASFEYRKDRSLSLSFANNQLTDVSRNSVILGLGYRFKDIAFALKAGGSTHNMKSDIVLKADLSYNENKTILRKIDLDVNQISTGSSVWAIGLSAEYAFSAKLTGKVFFNTNINNPYIANSIPTSNTRGGFSIRFSL